MKYNNRDCNARKSKLNPSAYTKAELVSLAKSVLNLSEKQAMKLTIPQLCERLSEDEKIFEVKGDCYDRSKIKLNSHQKKVVNHLMNNRGIIVVHGTGAGKTL